MTMVVARGDSPEPIDPRIVRLCARHSVRFGARLLQLSGGGEANLGLFHRVAAEMIRDDPDAAAWFLATLVALDIQRTAHPQTAHPQSGTPSTAAMRPGPPSRN